MAAQAGGLGFADPSDSWAAEVFLVDVCCAPHLAVSGSVGAQIATKREYAPWSASPPLAKQVGAAVPTW